MTLTVHHRHHSAGVEPPEESLGTDSPRATVRDDQLRDDACNPDNSNLYETNPALEIATKAHLPNMRKGIGNRLESQALLRQLKETSRASAIFGIAVITKEEEKEEKEKEEGEKE